MWTELGEDGLSLLCVGQAEVELECMAHSHTWQGAAGCWLGGDCQPGASARPTWLRGLPHSTEGAF